MVRSRRLLASLACVALPVAAAAAGDPALRFEEGVARHPDSARELYREQHWVRSVGDRPLERVVLYRCPDGTAFGRKRIDYRRSDIAPAFWFVDARSGYREGLRHGDGLELFFTGNSKAVERSAGVRSAQLVVDAGFDQFIRRNWTALADGDTLALDFAVPSRLRSMAFTVKRAGQSKIAGEAAWVFRLRLDGLLGLVVPAIDVSYGQQSRRLLRFEGLSNLRDDRGNKPLVARIDFPRPMVAADETQWQGALQTPLSACKTGH